MDEVDAKEDIEDDEEEVVEEVDVGDCSMCSDFGTEMAFWC